MATAPLAFVACHRRPDRSFAWRGRPFPVCARCTGILAGYALVPLFAVFGLPAYAVALGLLLNLPAAVDGVTQALGWRESRNPLRFATGLMCGVGQGMVVAWLGLWSGRMAVELLR